MYVCSISISYKTKQHFFFLHFLWSLYVSSLCSSFVIWFSWWSKDHNAFCFIWFLQSIFHKMLSNQQIMDSNHQKHPNWFLILFFCLLSFLFLLDICLFTLYVHKLSLTLDIILKITQKYKIETYRCYVYGWMQSLLLQWNQPFQYH